jgi:5-methylcytosine-specific restriction protein A
MTKARRLSMLGNRVSSIGRLAGANKQTVAIYGSSEWKAFIAGIIRDRGRRCEDPACKTPNRAAGQRVYGDHIVELKDGGALLDGRNVMLRCAPCHGAKTARERARRNGIL